MIAKVTGIEFSDETAMPKWMTFDCVKGDGKCQIALKPIQKNIMGASWKWDGNREAPTIEPSINCEKVCGWHGYITKGSSRLPNEKVP